MCFILHKKEEVKLWKYSQPYAIHTHSHTHTNAN